MMLTDSGGLQEECTVLGTQCITMRYNTERPITLVKYGGTCILVGNDVNRLEKEFVKMLSKKSVSSRPEMWDGKTAKRCLEAILAAQHNITRTCAN